MRLTFALELYLILSLTAARLSFIHYMNDELSTVKILISYLFFLFSRFLTQFLLPHNASFTEKKRRIYDQYGKEGLIGQNDNGYGSHHHRRRHDPFESEFIFGGGFPGFVFRDPEDVFREFFGGSPFDDFFHQQGRRHHPQNGHAGGSRQHQRPQQPNIMSPFFSLSLMDDMFSPHGFGMNSGFTSLSTFSNGGAMMTNSNGGGGNVKRISTSTSFVNGKKVTTKRWEFAFFCFCFCGMWVKNDDLNYFFYFFTGCLRMALRQSQNTRMMCLNQRQLMESPKRFHIIIKLSLIHVSAR